jgi:hypothetical protein
VIQIVQAKNRDGIEEYRRFLTSASLAAVTRGDWTAIDATQHAAIALRQEDTQTLRQLLNGAPAFHSFEARLTEFPASQVFEAKEFERSLTTYRTVALRNLVLVSSEAGILKGIFLLLDELEKQDGVLGPTAVVRYLSAMRAIIDALPNHLFLMIAVTPDAMRRYSSALPAFRSRLQNQITLAPLASVEEATELAKFYVDFGRAEARNLRGPAGGGDRELEHFPAKLGHIRHGGSSLRSPGR